MMAKGAGIHDPGVYNHNTGKWEFDDGARVKGDFAAGPPRGHIQYPELGSGDKHGSGKKDKKGRR